VYQQEQLNIQKRISEELVVANKYIDSMESYTAITAPESSLGIVLSEQKSSDIKLKHYYVRKRKLLYLLNCFSHSHPFSCKECGNVIELERLIILPNAHFCEACITSTKN